jgi:hypothetical protein
MEHCDQLSHMNPNPESIIFSDAITVVEDTVFKLRKKTNAGDKLLQGGGGIVQGRWQHSTVLPLTFLMRLRRFVQSITKSLGVVSIRCMLHIVGLAKAGLQENRRNGKTLLRRR